MSTSLFRAEPLAEQQRGWLGSVRLVRPLSLALLTAGVVAAATSAGAWLWFGEYTRKAQVSGVLVPDLGLIRLVTPVAGMLVERRAAEGQFVRAGELLFVVAIERTTLDGPAQAQVQGSLADRRRSLQDSARQRSALSGEERDTADRRLRDMQREADQIEAEAALQRQRMALAREALSRVETLAANQFISSAQVLAKSEELLALQVQGQGIERQRATLARERAAIEAERRGLPLRERARQGEIERELATLAREAAELEGSRRIEVRAPHDGTLGAVAVEVGQAVAASTTLASLVPAGAQLQAHLFAPSGAIGFVRPEQGVRLRLHAFAHQKFGVLPGRVVQVSRTPMATPDGAGGTAGEPMFRITVAVDPVDKNGATALPLAAGMRLDADVLLERRRLVEWLFAPVLGLARRSG